MAGETGLGRLPIASSTRKALLLASCLSLGALAGLVSVLAMLKEKGRAGKRVVWHGSN